MSDARPRRQGKAGLTPDGIGRAALAMFREEGELHIPRLADRLGVSQSAFYKHVAGRLEIIDCARGVLFEGLEPPQPEGDLGAYLRTTISRMYARYRTAPMLAAQLYPQTTVHREPYRFFAAFADGLIGFGVPLPLVLPVQQVIDFTALGAAVGMGIDFSIIRTTVAATPWGVAGDEERFAGMEAATQAVSTDSDPFEFVGEAAVRGVLQLLGR